MLVTLILNNGNREKHNKRRVYLLGSPHSGQVSEISVDAGASIYAHNWQLTKHCLIFQKEKYHTVFGAYKL